MRLAWLTDTHFNFLRDPSVFWKSVVNEGYDAFLITGDVSEANHLEYMFQTWWSAGKPVYFVLGNHDYYGSSIHTVRSRVESVTNSFRGEFVKYLGCMDVQKLTPSVALIGDDGWYDGRNGAYYKTEIQLNDFYCISEFKGRNKVARLNLMQELADASAKRVSDLIREALQDSDIRELFIATHVAPWAASAWHEGKPSDKYWQPFFSSQIMGRAIESAVQNSDVKVTVLCGHSHGGGTVHISENLVCHTGAAEYRNPQIARVFELT